jgi:single-stranded DNA-binding protein
MSMTFHLTGNLMKDPTFETFNDGKDALARLVVASNRERRPDITDFFDVTVFGDTAAAVANAVKGDRVAVAGEARKNNWTGNDGVRHFDVQLIGTDVTVTAKKTTQTAAATAERVRESAAATR